MILNAYTLHDAKALAYGAPFFVSNHALAIRAVSEVASDINTNIGRHPRDFTLYRVGTYDDQTGFLQPLEIREHVCDVITLVPPMPTPLFPKETQ